MMESIVYIFIYSLSLLSCVRSEVTCGEKWSEKDGFCYHISSTAEQSDMTWYDARAYCMGQGGDLASLHSKEEADFIYSLTEDGEYKGDLWIGLNQLENRKDFVWSDQTALDYEYWILGSADDSGLLQCTLQPAQFPLECFSRVVGMSTIKGLVDHPSEADGVDVFKFAYITTDDVDRCVRECAEESRCASFTFISNDHPEHTWKGECMGRSNRYSTNESDTYATSGARQACLGAWKNANCGQQRGFVCKKRKGEDTPKEPPTTPAVGGYCPEGYFGAGNKCYKIFPYTVNDGFNWTTALSRCRDEPGFKPDLASFHSMEDIAMVVSRIQSYIHGCWIGYKKMGEYWSWADNSRRDYENWSPFQPGFQGGCAELHTFPAPAGQWNSVNCVDKRGYICQTFKDPNDVIPTPPSTTPSRCSGGYQPYWYSCYKVDPTPRTWTAAMAHCESEGAHLTSIHNEAENSALFLMAGNDLPLWIGLEKTSNEYRWVDNWPVRFTYWDNEEPGNGEGCVALNSGGKWNDTQCDRELPTLCRKTDEKTPTIPPPADGVCPTSDWKAFGTYCYLISGESTDIYLSWQEARDKCERAGGHRYNSTLASVHNQVESDFIYDLVRGSSLRFDAWLGLYQREKDAPHEWTDGSAVQFTPWAPGEPNDDDGTQLCVEMYIQHWPGLWNDHICAQGRGYICKTLKQPAGPPPTLPPPVAGDCPAGEWEVYGEFCFRFEPNSKVTWDEAQAQCIRTGGRTAKLASVRHYDENEFIRTKMNEKTTGDSGNPWIGMFKTGAGQPYIWYDGSSADFYNWAPGEPNDPDGTDNCVEMYLDSGEWNDHNCAEERGYVCKYSKIDAGLTTTPSGPSNRTESLPGSGGGASHAAGVGVGVVLGTALLVSFAIITISCVKRRQQQTEQRYFGGSIDYDRQ